MAVLRLFAGPPQAPTNPDASSLLVAVVLLVLAALVVPAIITRAAGGRSLPVPFPGLGALAGTLRRLLRLLLLGLVILLLLQFVGDALRDDERLPVFIVDSKKTPTIAEHVRIAIAAGQPWLLHRVSEEQAKKNRRRACGRWPKGSKLSCDEYPFAATSEGGRGAHIMGVPLQEQLRQGGQLRGFYARNRIPLGGAFVVVVK
jgi:Deoxyribonuclease NucA/NucB